MDFDGFNAARSISHQPFWSSCYAPFVGLAFDFHGTVSVCAFTRSSPLGTVGETSLLEMWKGREIQSLRSAVTSGELRGSCTRCGQEIASGNFHGALSVGFDQFGAEQDPPWPRRIEFALSNSCNLQCVMCNGEFSSAIRAHREGLPPLASPYGDDFFEELTPFLAHLDQARFLGGEPFLASENFRIWDLMIETGSPAECNVTTNGTQWNSKVETALNQLPFSIGISMDGLTRQTVEYIRSGASYDRIMENLGRFIDYRDRRGTSLSLTFSLMVDNWHEFGEFLRFAEDIGCQVFVNTVRQPPHHSLYRLAASDLRPIVEQLQSDWDRVGDRLELNRPAWQEQVTKLAGHLRALETVEPELSISIAGHDASVNQRDLDSFIEMLGGATEDESVAVLSEASEDGRVSILRYGFDDRLISGNHYVGVTVNDLVGRPGSQLAGLLTARFGSDTEVVSEHVSFGTIARLVYFRRPDGPTTLIALVTRRGPDPFGITRLGATTSPKSIRALVS